MSQGSNRGSGRESQGGTPGFRTSYGRELHVHPGAHVASRLARYANRDLSWLDFNSRVLALAEDESQPLLERVKFLSIFSSNLDEFFQVRVALLHAEYESPVDVAPLEELSLDEQIDAIRQRVDEMTAREQDLFEKDLRPSLAREGIRICDWTDLDEFDRGELGAYYHERIFPALTPLAVDPSHPFPYVSNLSFNLAALVRDPDTGHTRFARIKLPGLFDRFLRLPDGERFVPIEQVVAAHLHSLFPGIQIESQSPFRVTRDADLDLEEDDAEDLLVAVESSLQRRRRLSDAVRLEIDEHMSADALELLLEELELNPEDVYQRHAMMDLRGLRQIAMLDRPELRDPSWAPQPVRAFTPHADGTPRNIFDVLRRKDVLVHHPYESFDGSVQAFLDAAADDPDVLAIKHTLYRSSGPENPLGRTIMRAASNGKQVVTLVELKARFDEETNIQWARTVEQAGVHVVYGLVGLKTHAKIILVVRREGDAIRRYCHIGTGNYHPVTARLYEDAGVFTANPEIGDDLSDLFNHLTGFSRASKYKKLLVAPHALRSSLVELVREEMAAPDGHVVVKCNNLSDPGMIDTLYEASQAGVKVDAVIRSICCLRPGVPGLSENITVRSVLGRFLEHSRIFRFGSPARGYRYYMGSADWMPRNLDRRVEVVVPIEDPALQERVEEILAGLLAEDALTWMLHDREWRRAEDVGGPSTQTFLQSQAAERARAIAGAVGDAGIE